MKDYALILNAGSSSLKFSVYGREEESHWQLESRGQIEGIGTSPRMTAQDGRAKPLFGKALGPEIRDSRDALKSLAMWLRSMYGGEQVVAVGHRIVHGGAEFTGPTVITPEVIGALRRLIPLAPLHQPHNIAGIEAAQERLPGVPQVACFDTSFHRGQPAVAELIPLPREVRNKGVQRYGFHGLSYEYIASVLPEVAPEIARGRVVVAHLGSGASLCALKNGKSIDCTLGFTALDGLCMGTRPGAVDPGVILYLLQTLELSPREVETMLYKKSGLLGISGASSDTRQLLHRDDPQSRLAVDYFVYRAVKEIAAMAAALGGIDGLVFTAGIGENSPEIRRRICEGCSWMGVALEPDANYSNGPRISSSRSEVSTWVIPTNEELMIARQTGALLGLIAAHT